VYPCQLPFPCKRLSRSQSTMGCKLPLFSFQLPYQILPEPQGLPSSWYFSQYVPCSSTPVGPLESRLFDSFVFWLPCLGPCRHLLYRLMTRLDCLRSHGPPYGPHRALCTLHCYCYQYQPNIKYGWLAKPYPTRTFTLSENGYR
jgi:hypothetical protein